MKNKLNAVYTLHSLHLFAGSLIGIFVPIYILMMHYSVSQIFIYYLTYTIIMFFLFLIASLIARKIGLKRTLLLSLPFQFAYLGLLYMLPFVHMPLWIIALTAAASASLYWYPLQLFFISLAQEKNMGNSVGKLFAFPRLITIASPLLGGLIALRGGFALLIITTVILYIISFVALFYLPDSRPTIQFKFKQFLKLARKYPRYLFAEAGENIREGVGRIVLPIFIFITFGSILSVGIIGSLLSVGSALFMLLIGHYTNQLNRKHLLRLGSIITMVIWTTFFFVHGKMFLYALTLIAGFFGALLLIPFNTLMYDYAEENTHTEFIILRQVPVTLARMLVYSFGLLFASSLGYIFLLPVFGSVFFWFL